jgi:hypothetical protein
MRAPRITSCAITRSTRPMPHRADETLGFDLLAVFLIAVVMPTGVMLMQSRRASKRWLACVIMCVALAWFATIERRRWTEPELVAGGVVRAARSVRAVRGGGGVGGSADAMRRLGAIVRGGGGGGSGTPVASSQ